MNFHVHPYISGKDCIYSAAVQTHNLTKFLLFLSDAAEAEVGELVGKLCVCTKFAAK